MTTPSVLSGDQKSDKNHHASGLVWDFMRFGFGRRALSLAEFGLLYSTCMILGLLLRESSQRLTIIWPAAGVLFMALWFSPRRNWIWILGVQAALEIVIDVTGARLPWIFTMG